MSNVSSRGVSIIFGIAFLAAGVLGYIPNPLVSPQGLFEVNGAHNLVHILTGTVFFAGGLISERVARMTVLSAGAAYVAVTILGFLIEGHLLLGLVHINEADKWLHAGLALMILAAGLGLQKPQPTSATNAA